MSFQNHNFEKLCLKSIIGENKEATGDKMPSQPITEYQFEELLEETAKEPNKVRAMRDTLYYEMLYYLGLRPKEARCIQINHINFKDHTYYLPAENNKVRHADDIFIPDFLWEKLELYLEKRRIRSKWLFPNLLHQDFVTKDKPVDERTCQREFTRRMRERGFIHVNYYDKQGIPRYNLNLYSFRKRFGTFVYKKTRDAKVTANMLRHYDNQLKSVWRYVFTAEKEERKDTLIELYS